MHSLLEKDDADIILIQEPWFRTVATLRSDTTHEGAPQLGAPIHSMWDLHTPCHAPTNTCKVVAYTRKTIASIIRNNTSDAVANLNTLALDILDDASIAMRLINIYHTVPPQGHNLHHLLHYDPDDRIPTVLLGDFNTHARRWSLPDRTPSSWALALTDWFDQCGFYCRNPRDLPTWAGSREGDRPSIIDLILANDAATYSAQLSDTTVSFEDSLGSDHAALTFTIYPLDSITLIPPPAPAGFHAEDS